MNNKVFAKEDKYKDMCPCSGLCCKDPKTYTPSHDCEESVCEECFVSECRNCGKSCSCDL